MRREHYRRWFRSAVARTEQAIGKTIGLLARLAAVNDQFGEPPEVFDQHDPQRDRNCPEFADRQWLYILVGAHKAAQQLGIEVTVGVRNERPGEAKNPGITPERTVYQLR